MTNKNDSVKIAVACPSGHRLRGDSKLVGKTVECPKCETDFVFAPTLSRHPDAEKTVTDTGVMRILGDMGSLPPAPERQSVETRPCTRCGVAISESLAVCNHCNCYVGVMPSFMRSMGPGEGQRARA